MAGATKGDVLELARSLNVRFMRLQFTDIIGINKNVEIPASQFEKALSGDIMFDGSSIEGFVRIEESDMLLAPDLSTFQIFPWGDPENRICRVICDINTSTGTALSLAVPEGSAASLLEGFQRRGNEPSARCCWISQSQYWRTQASHSG